MPLLLNGTCGRGFAPERAAHCRGPREKEVGPFSERERGRERERETDRERKKERERERERKKERERESERERSSGIQEAFKDHRISVH